MGFPPYLIGIGIPLLVGLLGLGYLIYKQERPGPRYNYEREGEYHRHRSYSYNFYNDSEEECTICLQNITSSASKQLPCGHRLHTTCLEELRKRSSNAKCPQCRADI